MRRDINKTDCSSKQDINFSGNIEIEKIKEILEITRGMFVN